MELVKPEVYLVSETSLHAGNLPFGQGMHWAHRPTEVEGPPGMWDFLQAIGNPKWRPNFDHSDGENLIEFAGRMCYRSWEPFNPDKPNATNANVTKVREGNDVYIGNILKQKHGAVLEHFNLGFVFHNISRVFTHELVRHRIASYSQESLRFVRLNNLRVWVPDSVREAGGEEAITLFEDTIKQLEIVQNQLAAICKIDEITNFKVKKKLQSMFRRLAPIGLATTIMMTANVRTWRWLMELRTAESAEEEIRIMFQKVATICYNRYPSVFGDMAVNMENEVTFENKKV